MDPSSPSQMSKPASDGPSTQLPLSNISRLMKSNLPTSPCLKISSSSKTTMQEIVHEFITFVTCEAQEHADGQKRSTLNGDDILYALEVLGFDDCYKDVGKIWLSRYRIAQEATSASRNRKPSTAAQISKP
ncbi:unnamed protein product [Sympodiomycopsis kandeliae]